MEVYTLDRLYRRVRVIDLFESLIWTERWYAYGDFELVVHSTKLNRRLLIEGTRLAMNNSDRVMTIEEVTDDLDSEGRSILKVKGRSLEQILEERVAMHLVRLLGHPEANENWDIDGTPAQIARYIYGYICVEGTLDVGDIIPATFGEGNSWGISPPDTIPEPTDYIRAEVPLSSVYEALKNLCIIYEMGFRFLRHPITSELFFDVYMGSDRTTRQTILPPVLFSTDFDNLLNVSVVTSIMDVKNVAYVISKNGAEIVYADNVDPSISGFKRRVMHVSADDIDAEITGNALKEILIKRGREALALQKGVTALDGEIAQNSQYKYGVDYWLGDVVEMRNSDGLTNHMRVTEQIFVSDSEGERSYPTLAFKHSIMPGTWESWESNGVWEEELGVWEDASS